MPVALTDDGVKLHYESVGTGTPVVFVHEFAGDHRSWEPQLRASTARISWACRWAASMPCTSGWPFPPARAH